jgi:WD40 repeat protein
MIALALLVLAAGPPVQRADTVPKGAVARLGQWRVVDPAGHNRHQLTEGGRFLVVHTARKLQLFDARSGTLVRERPIWHGYGLAWTAVAVCPKADRVIAYGDEVLLAKLGGGKIEATLFGPRQETTANVSYSGDGGRAAFSAGRNGRAAVRVCDLEKRKEVCRIVKKGFRGHVALSPNGKALATWGPGEGEWPTALSVYDADSGKLLRTFDKGDKGPYLAGFAPDGKTFATVHADARLVVWALAGGKQLREAALPAGSFVAVCFSSDSRRVATGTAAGAVRVLDVSTGRVRPLLSPKGASLTALTFLPDGKLLAAGTISGGATTWFPAEKPAPLAGPGMGIQALAFSSDGKRLLFAGAGGGHVWDVQAGSELRRVPHPLGAIKWKPGQPAAYAPDGRHVAMPGPRNAIVMMNPDTGRAVWKARPPLGECGLSGVAFGAGGGKAVTGRPGKVAGRPIFQVWGLPSLKEGPSVEVACKDLVADPVLSPDGSAVCLVGQFNREKWGVEVVVVDVASGERLVRFEASGLKSTVAFSPDGRVLAYHWFGGVVAFRDLQTGRQGGLIAHKNCSCGPMCFSPDGRLLAVGGGGGATVAEVATGRIRLRLSGHAGPVQALAFSPDGTRLATGSADATAIVWDLTGREWSRSATRRPGRADWDGLNRPSAEEAWGSMARLVCHPREAVALLRRHLRPAPGKGLTDAVVARLISQLGSDDFERRQAAEMALRVAATGHATQLLRVLQKGGDLEVKMRLRRILQHVPAWPDPELLRPVRAVEVLERLGTAEARKFLRELSGGNAEARLTREAKAALKRLEKSP